MPYCFACCRTRQNAPGEAQTPETQGASFLAETLHLSASRRQIRGVLGQVRPPPAPAANQDQTAPPILLVGPSPDLAGVRQLGRKIPSFMKDTQDLNFLAPVSGLG